MPPDPAACATFGDVYESTHYYTDTTEMAKLGCLRKLNEWNSEIGNDDVNVIKLLAAIINGDLNSVKELAAKVDMQRESPDYSGLIYEYLLQATVLYGRVDIARELLKSDADVKKMLQEDVRSAFRVIFSAYFLTERSPYTDEVATEVIRAYIKNGLDVNQHIGKCALSLWAIPRARNGMPIVRELEKLGYQVTQQDKDYALLLAALFNEENKERGNVETVKALVKEGADVNGRIECQDGTVYARVKEHGTPEMIALFKQLGAKD